MMGSVKLMMVRVKNMHFDKNSCRFVGRGVWGVGSLEGG
jgi:hypothetical protein